MPVNNSRERHMFRIVDATVAVYDHIILYANNNNLPTIHLAFKPPQTYKMLMSFYMLFRMYSIII